MKEEEEKRVKSQNVVDASDYVDKLMLCGKNKIDMLFGEGYCANHPELLISYMDMSVRIGEISDRKTHQ